MQSGNLGLEVVTTTHVYPSVYGFAGPRLGLVTWYLPLGAEDDLGLLLAFKALEGAVENTFTFSLFSG